MFMKLLDKTKIPKALANLVRRSVIYDSKRRPKIGEFVEFFKPEPKPTPDAEKVKVAPEKDKTPIKAKPKAKAKSTKAKNEVKTKKKAKQPAKKRSTTREAIPE